MCYKYKTFEFLWLPEQLELWVVTAVVAFDCFLEFLEFNPVLESRCVFFWLDFPQLSCCIFSGVAFLLPEHIILYRVQ